ncbi:MAG: serine hydrolase [Flavobacteriales bacterium]|nr:serine hydrolase [Flavobacteriales bacterium]MDG1781783.1 serine hydrolase [Flavobacteriales bacterium]MDG2246023.1 serine hydrolase [Flavobacteriales bacterium]
MKKLLFALVFTVALGYANGQVESFPTLDSLCQQVFDENGPAAGIMVSKDGANVYSYFSGFDDIDQAIPASDGTVFSMASISKQFTAAGIFILKERGMLSLDDDIRMHFPDMLAYNKEPIRISHLLHHTSGIRNYNVLAYLGSKEDEITTNEGIYRLLLRQRGVSNRPNERMLYSNSNYVLLAELIEKVAKKPFHQFMRDEVFLPLGMDAAFFVSDSIKANPSGVLRYYFEGEEYVNQNSKALVVGPGGMGSNLPDLLKWTTVFEGGHSGWPSLGEFLTEQLPLSNGEENSYANGVFVSTYKGYQVVHHSGRTRGSRSQLISIPELRLSVVIGANTNAFNVVDLSYDVLDYFLEDDSIEEEKPFEGVINYERLLGTYQEQHSDLAMTIYSSNDTLYAKSSFGRNGVPLRPIGHFLFERFSTASVTYSFPPYSEEYDLLVDFNGAAFRFEKVEMVNPEKVDLSLYEGAYYSSDLDLIYTFRVKDDALVLSFGEQDDLPLHTCRKDEFGSFDRTVYEFGFDAAGEALGFVLASEGTVFGIRFEKIR